MSRGKEIGRDTEREAEEKNEKLKLVNDGVED